MHFSAEKFGSEEKSLHLCNPKREQRVSMRRFLINAEIAQLVEHNLAKVRVASSSLVFRSKREIVILVVSLFLCPVLALSEVVMAHPTNHGD